MRGILERRLVIVTGKGGTGKTTVAAALALAAARAGQRVLVLETGRDEAVPRLFGEPAPVGYAGRTLRAGPTVRRIDPYAALSEYLDLQLRVPGIAGRVLGNKGFRRWLDAAPGWRELITLGKVWHLEQARSRRPRGSDRPEWDLLIVDAPATGHGLTFLDVPGVVASAVRAGPLRRHATWVEALVHDPTRTLLLPVALAEELPARETAELIARVRNELGVPVDRVVINAVRPDPLPPGLDDLPERLAEHLPDGFAGLDEVVGHARDRHRLNARHVEGIRRGTGLPAVTLPYCIGGVGSLVDLEALIPPLLGAAS